MLRSSGRCRQVVLLALCFAIGGCDEQILHDLSEREANKVLSRLSTGQLGAKKILQSDGRWAIAVSRDSIVTALSFLDTNRVLSGRGSGIPTQAKGGLVPSREEQWFHYERSVATAIEESLSTVLGVLEARVHLNLPETDPLFGTRKENIGTGSVLLVIDGNFTAKDEEIAALVAGAAGIPATKVTVLRSFAQVSAKRVASDHSTEEVIDVEVQLHDDPRSSPVNHIVRSWTQVSLASVVTGMLLVGAFMARKQRKRIKFVLPDSQDEKV